jgi:hypothetical protein
VERAINVGFCLQAGMASPESAQRYKDLYALFTRLSFRSPDYQQNGGDLQFFFTFFFLVNFK